MIDRFKEKTIYWSNMRILIRYYNGTNLGDDLFVKMLVDRYPNHKFIIPVYGSNKLNIRADNLKIIKLPFSYKWFAALGKIIDYANPQLFLLSLRSDLMIYIGGSIFMEPKISRTWKRELKFYRSLRVPYYIIGSNIGPYRSTDFLPILRQILEGAQDVCLRDNASYELVKELSNVRVATDLVFALETKSYQLQQSNTAIISVIDAYKKFNDEIARKYEKDIAELTSELVNRGMKVVYMSFCRFDGDESANRRIIDSLPSYVRKNVEEQNYRGDLAKSLGVISSSKVIIASRFHAAILGLTFNKKVVPVAYSDKLLNVLNDVNFKGPVIDIRNIISFNPKSVDFDGLQRLNIDARRKLANEHFEALDKLLLGNFDGQ